MPQKKGFTLIELMVVITIIAVLSLIGFAVYGKARSLAGDTKRKADIDSIAKVYEQKYNFALAQPYQPYQGTDFNGGQPPADPATGNEYLGVIPSGGATGFNICADLSDGLTRYCRVSSRGTTPSAPTAPGTYSQSFTYGVGATTQCTAWDTWRASLTGTYTTVTLKGSNDLNGVSCTGTTANTICRNLRTGTAMGPTACGGRNWTVGIGCAFAGAVELTANGNICVCDSGSSYTARPCIGNQNWGGINGATCNAPSQTITVICQ